MTEKLSKPKVAVSLTVFALAIGGMFVWYSGELPTGSFPAVNLTAEHRNLLALVSYVNERGEEWSIPTGDYAFTVSSNPKLYPRFLSGDIDPLDVKVGDTQRMKIVVVDVAAPKRVWAEIEHDSGKDTVELTLTGTKALAREELEKRPYLVDESGKLILNDASQKLSVKSIVDRLVSRAEAEGEAEYTYEGSWVVHDTHTKTYRTTFVAESLAGIKRTFEMAWSDPVCRFSSAGVLQGTCTPTASSDYEGFDGAGMNLQNFNINLSSAARLVFNPGTSVDLSQGATITNIVNGATIQEGYLYYADADGDRYTPSVQRYVFSSPTQSGYVRARDVQGATDPNNAQVPLTANLDCWDGNVNARPGQTAYFAVHRGDGSFDYDCSAGGSIQRSIPRVYVGQEDYCVDNPGLGKWVWVYDESLREEIDYERIEGAEVWKTTNPFSPQFPACGTTAERIILGPQCDSGAQGFKGSLNSLGTNVQVLCR